MCPHPRLSFDGFMSVYAEEDEKEQSNALIGKLEPGMELTLEKFDSSQHFTQPPAHYTEASLVKALEEQGIGRPSTYAPTITTIIARRYVAKENKNLYVTELGEVVNRIMKEAFPKHCGSCSLLLIWSMLLDSVGEGTVRLENGSQKLLPGSGRGCKDSGEGAGISNDRR